MLYQNTQKPINSTWMTVEQLAEYLSVSPDTIRNWVSQKNIPYAKRGRVVRFHKQKIDDWLSEGVCKGRPTIDHNIFGNINKNY